ncbi:MAG TPA: ornithine carbamoyltransferase [Candidatus Binatia bacterium]|nr:ornithine carbamoyltransferase [Candidatus Binatia bacterium]
MSVSTLRPSTGSRGTSTPAHVLSVCDALELGLERVLSRAAALRADRRSGRRVALLAGRQVALVFEKPSLRTRVTFDVGVELLGGHAIYLGPAEVGLGSREAPGDVAANLSRWVDAIVVRTFAHDTLLQLAAGASVPVVNALTDREHPCQALADLLTLRQHLGGPAGRSVAFIGDGNNVCHSLLLAGAAAGMEVRVATPPGHGPLEEVVVQARHLARRSGGAVDVGTDPVRAVTGADAVYTDVWTSMGFEQDADARRAHFAGYRVDAALLTAAPDALVMHCLPAHRGEEITSEVLDGERSVVLDQAENRLYVQQALLLELLAS